MIIYCIINKLHDKVYVGQTVQPIERRFKQHVCRSLANGSQNRALAEDFNKFDEYFSITILQHLDDNINSSVVYEIEDYWINKMITEGYGTYNKDGVRKDPEIFVIEMEDKYGDNLLNVNNFVNKELEEDYEELEEEEEVQAIEAFIDLKTGKTYTRLIDCSKEVGVATYMIKRSCLGYPEHGRFIYTNFNHGQGYTEYDFLEDNSVFNFKKRGPVSLILSKKLNRIYANREACALAENISNKRLRKLMDNGKDYVALYTRVPERLLYHPEKDKEQLMKDAEEIATMFYNEPAKVMDTSAIKEVSVKLVETEQIEPTELKALSKQDFSAIIYEVYSTYGPKKAAELLVKFGDLF